MPKKKNGAAASATTADAPMTKTAFVKSLPADMPVADVLEKAKEAGITISKNYVYLIRSGAKAKGKGSKAGKAGKGARRGRGRGPSTTVAAASPRTRSGLDARFANIVAEIGLARAEELLRSVRSKFVG